LGEEWKCPKCGSSGNRKRELYLRGIMDTSGLLDSEPRALVRGRYSEILTYGWQR